VPRYLDRHGLPIRYGYVSRPWPLEYYQTVFATQRGSAEMPSAGRPFTDRMVTRLVVAGVRFAPVLLHTGVASPETGERPYPERFVVPATTARVVNEARADGGRIVAVGTTAVRAVESAVDDSGIVHAARGWTDLIVTPDRGGTGRGRSADRVPRAARVTSGHGRRDRRAGTAGALLRRCDRRRLPVARVRRPQPDPAALRNLECSAATAWSGRAAWTMASQAAAMAGSPESVASRPIVVANRC